MLRARATTSVRYAMSPVTPTEKAQERTSEERANWLTRANTSATRHQVRVLGRCGGSGRGRLCDPARRGARDAQALAGEGTLQAQSERHLPDQ